MMMIVDQTLVWGCCVVIGLFISIPGTCQYYLYHSMCLDSKVNGRSTADVGSPHALRLWSDGIIADARLGMCRTRDRCLSKFVSYPLVTRCIFVEIDELTKGLLKSHCKPRSDAAETVPSLRDSKHQLSAQSELVCMKLLEE